MIIVMKVIRTIISIMVIRIITISMIILVCHIYVTPRAKWTKRMRIRKMIIMQRFRRSNWMQGVIVKGHFVFLIYLVLNRRKY